MKAFIQNLDQFPNLREIYFDLRNHIDDVFMFELFLALKNLKGDNPKAINLAIGGLSSSRPKFTASILPTIYKFLALRKGSIYLDSLSLWKFDEVLSLDQIKEMIKHMKSSRLRKLCWWTRGDRASVAWTECRREIFVEMLKCMEGPGSSLSIADNIDLSGGLDAPSLQALATTKVKSVRLSPRGTIIRDKQQNDLVVEAFARNITTTSLGSFVRRDYEFYLKAICDRNKAIENLQKLTEANKSMSRKSTSANSFSSSLVGIWPEALQKVFHLLNSRHHGTPTYIWVQNVSVFLTARWEAGRRFSRRRPAPQE